MMTELLKTVLWTDYSVKIKLNIGKLSQLSISYLFSLIRLTV
jgi:hypothetical protein